MRCIISKSPTKEEIRTIEKKELLEYFYNIKREFINIERKIAKDFMSFSLNEIIDLKKVLSDADDKMKKIAIKLEKRHQFVLDLEDRNF